MRQEESPLYWSSAVEIGRIAVECVAHDGLHLSMDHVVLESVDGAHSGEAVVTTLNNFAMQLIRYRLGDIISFLHGHCSCGSFLPRITPPIGRAEELIMLPSGKALIPQGIHSILRVFSGLNQYSLIQESSDRFVLQLDWRNRPREERLLEIRAQLNQFFGEPVRLDIQNVESIPEEKLKFRAFISRLPGK